MWVFCQFAVGLSKPPPPWKATQIASHGRQGVWIGFVWLYWIEGGSFGGKKLVGETLLRERANFMTLVHSPAVYIYLFIYMFDWKTVSRRTHSLFHLILPYAMINNMLEVQSLMINTGVGEV